MSDSGARLPAARLVLDTSAYTHLRAGSATVLDWTSAADVVSLTCTTLGELEAGFVLGSRYQENRRVLDDFLDEPFVSVLAVDAETARHYGAMFAELRRAGTPIPVNDIWIAARTTQDGSHLVTFDADFSRIVGLDCTILRPGQ